ncbi:hypothetical protein [Desulfovibrio sp.]|uniref:hypothetical protein n=1 Tax=Desulfovibrio sp. TaxID=885 RepID=UPI003AB4B9A0
MSGGEGGIDGTLDIVSKGMVIKFRIVDGNVFTVVNGYRANSGRTASGHAAVEGNIAICISGNQSFICRICTLLKSHIADRRTRLEIDDSGVSDAAAIAGIHMHIVDVQGTTLGNVQGCARSDSKDTTTFFDPVILQSIADCLARQQESRHIKLSIVLYVDLGTIGYNGLGSTQDTIGRRASITDIDLRILTVNDQSHSLPIAFTIRAVSRSMDNSSLIQTATGEVDSYTFFESEFGTISFVASIETIEYRTAINIDYCRCTRKRGYPILSVR